MRFLRRRAVPVPAAPPPSFGPWLLRHFARGEATAEMTFSRLERVCSNAGSVLCGAAYANPEALMASGEIGATLASEAALVAKRTGDGFRACLADRQHTVITWPWDHMATRVAWEASRNSEQSEETVGRRLCDIGAAYAVRHRQQLATALDLWRQVTAGLKPGVGSATTPGLEEMGNQLLVAFEAEQASI